MRRGVLGLRGALLAAPALGQSLWPTGPIRFTVTFPAGGSTDLRVGRAEVGDGGGDPACASPSRSTCTIRGTMVPRADCQSRVAARPAIRASSPSAMSRQLRAGKPTDTLTGQTALHAGGELMTDDERRLLLCLARWVAEHLEEKAADLNTTDNLVVEIRRLVDRVRPQGGG